MATDMVDLWPADLGVDALTPLMILNEQAEALTRRTKGIVRAEVTEGVAFSFHQLALELFAPAVGFRQRLLFIRYAQEQPYPAVVIAQALSGDPRADLFPEGADTVVAQQEWKLSGPEGINARVAHSPEDVRDLLKMVFNAPSTKAALFSLIARSNELRAKSQAKGESANGNNAGPEA